VKKRHVAEFVVAALFLPASAALSQQELEPAAEEIVLPRFKLLRFNEDWSTLKDVSRDQLSALDSIKYIPLDEEGDAWLSLGGHTRFRAEVWDIFGFGAPAED